MFVPKENADEAAVIDGIHVFPVGSLTDVIKHYRNEEKIKEHKVNLDDLFSAQKVSDFDFADVKGQENVKRALEIAAAGNHNIILI